MLNEHWEQEHANIREKLSERVTRLIEGARNLGSPISVLINTAPIRSANRAYVRGLGLMGPVPIEIA